jgi:hypothetical protein
MLTIRHRITFEHELLKGTNCIRQEDDTPIHKHTVWVFVKIYGDLDNDGYLQNYVGDRLDPVYVKKLLRDYLDSKPNNPIFLNEEGIQTNYKLTALPDNQDVHWMKSDPTYFALAKRVAKWALEALEADGDVEVYGDDEVTASYGYHWENEDDGRVEHEPA